MKHFFGPRARSPLQNKRGVGLTGIAITAFYVLLAGCTSIQMGSQTSPVLTETKTESSGRQNDFRYVASVAPGTDTISLSVQQVQQSGAYVESTIQYRRHIEKYLAFGIAPGVLVGGQNSGPLVYKACHGVRDSCAYVGVVLMAPVWLVHDILGTACGLTTVWFTDYDSKHGFLRGEQALVGFCRYARGGQIIEKTNNKTLSENRESIKPLAGKVRLQVRIEELGYQAPVDIVDGLGSLRVPQLDKYQGSNLTLIISPIKELQFQYMLGQSSHTSIISVTHAMANPPSRTDTFKPSKSYESTKQMGPIEWPGSRENIAVANLDAFGFPSAEAVTLSENVRATFSQTPCFLVVSRMDMSRMLEEAAFQRTSDCSDDQCLVQMGKVLAVRLMCGGTVGRVGGIYNLALRIVNVETGAIEVSLVDDVGDDPSLLLPAIRSLTYQMAQEYALKRRATKK